MSDTPLSPEEAAQMLDAIEQRFRTHTRQISLLALAVLALAGSLVIIQWRLAHIE